MIIKPAANERETVTRLLDAAERLFGEAGFDGVGMRALAREAKVNLGAATYHFGSKEKLYSEMFLRRFRPMNAERLRLLREAEARAKGRRLAVETIVECMVRPPYLLGLQHPEFNAMVARSLFFPPAFLENALREEFEPPIRVFMKAFCRSLPRHPRDLILLREMFSMGALMTFTICQGKLPRRNARLTESILRELVRFIAAGLESTPALRHGSRPAFPMHPFLLKD